MKSSSESFYSHYRRTNSREVFDGYPAERGVYDALVEMAAFSPKLAHRGRRVVTLQPGQLVVSLAELKKISGMSERSTRTLIGRLRNWSKIDIDSDTTSYMITICDYVNFGKSKIENDTVFDTSVTQVRHKHSENDTVFDTDKSDITYCYDEVITDSNFENDTVFDTALRIKEGKKDKEEILNPLSGGNSLARARPGDNDHHLGGEIKSAKDALRKAEEEIRFLKLRGSLGDDKLIAKVVQIAKEHFDESFRDHKTFAKRGFAGFDYNDLNLAVAGMIDEKGIDWTIAFGKWLPNYRRGNGGYPLKLKYLGTYRNAYESGKTIEDLTAMSRRYAELRGN